MAELKALQGKATRRDVIKGSLKAGAYAAPIIAAGAVPFAVGAVTGVRGIRLLVNGQNTITIAFGNSFTISASGLVPNQTVTRIIASTTVGGALSFRNLVADANGNLVETINTGNNTAIVRGTLGAAPTAGNQFVIALATDVPGANPGAGVAFPGELVRTTITVVGGGLATNATEE